MINVHELAEKAFGKYEFAGFYMIVREAGARIGVYIGSVNDVKHHKLDVLSQVCKERPYLSVRDAILCIEHICEKQMFSEEEIVTLENDPKLLKII